MLHQTVAMICIPFIYESITYHVRALCEHSLLLHECTSKAKLKNWWEWHEQFPTLDKNWSMDEEIGIAVHSWLGEWTNGGHQLDDEATTIQLQFNTPYL